MNVPLLDLRAQYATLKSEISTAVQEVFESQQFILGPGVATFEEEIAEYLGVPHALGVSSGTDALLLSLMALGIGSGDEVITTPFTFVATVETIARVGAKPVFVDILPDTFNLAPEQLEAAMTDRTQAVIPVHLFGQCADMDPILELAARRDMAVIEDAAQAVGALYGERPAGSMGRVGCFSFFPSKNLGAAGDAGLVVTGDSELYERLKMGRVHGAASDYRHQVPGGNFRIDALQAAVLRVKLKYLAAWSRARAANARYYDEAFAGVEGIVTPVVASGNSSVYHQYVVRVANRDGVRAAMTEAGVGTAVYYPSPHHLAERFRELGHGPGDFPEAERAAGEVLALPVYPELSGPQKAHVAESLIAAVS